MDASKGAHVHRREPRHSFVSLLSDDEMPVENSSRLAGQSPIIKVDRHTHRAGRGGGIRTHDLFVPNEARYQAAPHPA
jgi:hypothetical protein